MVDLLGHPYPHPRHVRQPDQFRRLDWLVEIGALIPRRRVEDTALVRPDQLEQAP